MKTAVLLEAPAAAEPNLYLAWYEAWRAEEDRKSAAAAAARERMRRDLRLMVGLLVAWAVLAGLAGGLALLLWTGG